MSGTDSRASVISAARRLFGERGYNGVTIRQVAAEAGLSPAMVMKVVGSKARLYADAAPMESAPLDQDLPADRLGRELVRRVLVRRREDAAEPWARVVHLTRASPDPESSRAEFRRTYLAGLSRALGDGPEVEQRAELIGCMLIGLATGVRTLRLLEEDDAGIEAAIDRYGALVQSLVDG